MGRIQSLQALRFLAALGVVIAHLASFNDQLEHQTLIPWQHAGTVGVDVFFVISGFIIAKIGFLDRKPTARAFIAGRLVRIVPIYWVLTLPWFLVPNDPITLPRLIASLFFWPAASDQLAYPVLYVGWTLCFEMLFYALASVAIATARPRLALAAFTGALIVLVTARYGPGADLPVIQFLGNPMSAEFLLGVGLANLARPRPRLSIALFVAGAAIFGVFGLRGYFHDGNFAFHGVLARYRVIVFGLPAGSLVYCALQHERLFQNAFGRVLAYLGDTSYALYLTHPLTLLAALYAAPAFGVRGPVFFAGGMVAAVGAAILVHEALEKPLISLFRRKPTAREALARAS